MSLFRIFYVSDAVGDAGAGLLPLIDIIGASDRNNRRDHVTGFLLRHQDRFFQLLEGGRVDLERLMGRLAADRRHQNIRVLVDTPVDRRLFPQWAMAQIDPLPSLEPILTRLAGTRLLSDVTFEVDQVIADARLALDGTR